VIKDLQYLSERLGISMKSVLTLTMNPCIDKSMSAEGVAPDRKVRCGEPRYEPGGGGVNVSRAIKNLGGDSRSLFPRGGPWGDLLVALLQREGIDPETIPLEDWTRENVIVNDDSSGRQYRFSTPGPVLTEEEWSRCLDWPAFPDEVPDYVVASGGLPRGVPEDFYARFFAEAKKRGARTVLDTAGKGLKEALEKGVFLIKPNLREFREMSGAGTGTEGVDEACASSLVREGKVEILAVSLGSEGVLVAWDEGCRRIRAPKVDVASKVGAGDSTVAGLVLGLARGYDVMAAVRFGVAAGAAAVMTPGTALCRREDTERLFRDMGGEM
jgi:6-phosphofructokinase 2